MSQVTAQVGNNFYKLSETSVLNLINIALEKYNDEGKLAIVAVKKGNTFFFLREVYETKTQLKEARRNYKVAGMKVYSTN